MQKVLPKVILFHIAASQAALRPDHAALANHLKQASIDFEQVSHWDQSHLDADLVIVCSAIPQALIPDHTKIVGQRTLNRRTRLDALKGFDNFVQPYGCPNSSKALSSLLADWDATCGVIKYDWSYRRVGVDLICATENELPTLPADFDCGADVVMKVHDGDPATIKVDAFAGTVLGAARLDTRKIGDPNWQLIGPRGLEPYELDESTKAMVATASAALLAFGVGYASFDVMLGPDGPRIIEVNSTGVGTLFWSEHPEPYSQLFASAIVDCLAQLDNVPTFGTLREMAIRSNNEREAYAPEASDEPDQSVPDLSSQLDKMVEQAEGFSEEEREDIGSASFGALAAHACEHVPAYKGHTPDTLPIVSQALLRSDTTSFVARFVPGEHGTVHHAPLSSTDEGGVAIACSHFSLLFEDAIRRRALRLAGVDTPGKLVSLLDATSSMQQGLGHDSSTADILDYINAEKSVSLILRRSTAFALAEEMSKGKRGKALRGVIIADATLTLLEKQRLETAFDCPVSLVLYSSATGTVGCKCPNSEVIHIFSDMAKASLDANDQLCLTGFFNYTMPVLHYQMPLKANRLIDQSSCQCSFEGAPSFLAVEQSQHHKF